MNDDESRGVNVSLPKVNDGSSNVNERSIIVNVRLMGTLECSCNGKRMDFVYNTGSKMSQLLLMLLFNAHNGVPRSQILEALYHDSEADPVNSLKTLFSRLRSAFSAAIGLPGGESLVLNNGIYDVAPGIEVHCDTGKFYELCARADKESDEAVRARILEEAYHTYTGELLPMLATESWVIFENAALSDNYFRILRQLCAYYIKTKDYESASQCYKRALIYFPMEEEWVIGRINSLLSMGKYNQALAEYEEITEQLFDELGVYPSEKLMDALRRISDKLSFSITTAENLGSALDEGAVKGAYYCSYPNFLSSFHILKRVMVRNELSAVELLFTVVDENNKPLENKGDISNAIAALHIALGKSLRRSDMFTRFSKTQMLVMLWNTNPESAKIAIDRVTHHLEEDDVPGSRRFICTVLAENELPVETMIKQSGKKTWRSVR